MKEKMLKTRRGYIEESEGSTYWRCIHLYYGEHDTPANYTTTTTVSTTTAIHLNTIPSGYATPSTSSLEDSDAQEKSIILWSSIGTTIMVVLCVVVICGLIMSRRSERLKRKRTEAEYRVIATTLTSISTDVEDGTTYEELSSLSDPAYRGNEDLQLPSRKQRQRLGGVSNGLTQTVKRWFSIEGNEPTKNTTNFNGTVTMSRPPLPSIPETNNTSLYRSKSDKRVSAHNGEYVEIGADILRRSNVYNPLDGVSGSGNADPYDKLRKSTLLVDSENDYPGLRKDCSLPENRSSSNYFILEKEDNTSNPVTEPSDNYFILEKTEGSKLNVTAIDGASEPDNSADKQDCEPPVKPEEIKQENVSGDTDSTEQNNKNKDDYFILDPDAKQRTSSSGDDYLEPTDKHRHSYIEVLPEHREMCKKSKK